MSTFCIIYVHMYVKHMNNICVTITIEVSSEVKQFKVFPNRLASLVSSSLETLQVFQSTVFGMFNTDLPANTSLCVWYNVTLFNVHYTMRYCISRIINKWNIWRFAQVMLLAGSEIHACSINDSIMV